MKPKYKHIITWPERKTADVYMLNVIMATNVSFSRNTGSYLPAHTLLPPL